MKKIVLLAFVLVLLLTAMFVRLVRPVVAEKIIYSRSDGSVQGKIEDSLSGREAGACMHGMSITTDQKEPNKDGVTYPKSI